MRREQNEVNDQVHDLLRAESGEEVTTMADEEDIIDIPDTTVEGTTNTDEGGVATRTRARRLESGTVATRTRAGRLESGTVLAYLDADWEDKIQPSKFNQSAYWNNIIMTQMSARELSLIHI